jgi:hypothetical protein
VEVYDEALRLSADDWELWFSKGQCCSQTKDCDRQEWGYMSSSSSRSRGHVLLQAVTALLLCGFEQCCIIEGLSAATYAGSSKQLQQQQ